MTKVGTQVWDVELVPSEQWGTGSSGGPRAGLNTGVTWPHSRLCRPQWLLCGGGWGASWGGHRDHRRQQSPVPGPCCCLHTHPAPTHVYSCRCQGPPEFSAGRLTLALACALHFAVPGKWG